MCDLLCYFKLFCKTQSFVRKILDFVDKSLGLMNKTLGFVTNLWVLYYETQGFVP